MLSSTIKFAILYFTSAHKGVDVYVIIKIYLFSDIVTHTYICLYKLIFLYKTLLKCYAIFEIKCRKFKTQVVAVKDIQHKIQHS